MRSLRRFVAGATYHVIEISWGLTPRFPSIFGVPGTWHQTSGGLTPHQRPVGVADGRPTDPSGVQPDAGGAAPPPERRQPGASQVAVVPDAHFLSGFLGAADWEAQEVASWQIIRQVLYLYSGGYNACN